MCFLENQHKIGIPSPVVWSPAPASTADVEVSTLAKSGLVRGREVEVSIFNRRESAESILDPAAKASY